MKSNNTPLRLINNPSAIIERQGLFEFASKTIPSSEALLNIAPVLRLFGNEHSLDHMAIVLSTATEWNARIERLIDLGAILQEGPGLFPHEYCELMIPDDYNMHFASLMLPTGLILVLSAPHQDDDQLSAFIKQRGEGIHHLAIKSDDLNEALVKWRQFNFVPLSEVINDAELGQQFLINPQGQILETIQRKKPSVTFSCGNLARLRLAERKAA